MLTERDVYVDILRAALATAIESGEQSFCILHNRFASRGTETWATEEDICNAFDDVLRGDGRPELFDCEELTAGEEERGPNASWLLTYGGAQIVVLVPIRDQPPEDCPPCPRCGGEVFTAPRGLPTLCHDCEVNYV
jgi:hypothetical protein